ncbi:glycosyltransferase family 4 protein [uncultured Alteromonas sp.]|jgi:glycosyltransferase involved in cell wall biosynthesis|uniref:glycosyltransferase family 4 protein n=1 Tax=uncultured Alteromonas sp. TaxID=179113 RepID=UPI0030D76228
MKQRILVVSHGHPDFSLGGAEIAAYNLFEAFKKNEDVEDTWFLARADRGRGITGQIHKRRDNEYLWEQGIADWHLMKSAHQESVTTWFVDLLKSLKPTVVHIHHYAHIGLEFIRAIKKYDSNIKVYLTLHEYMAICKHNGQMVKTGKEMKLCSSESYDECRGCFPENTAEDFWLRKHHFKSAFDLADGFISPSEFLRQRYIDWGINEDHIVVIENGQTDLPPLAPRPIAENETRNRFGYFGQVNPYKGIDILLEALRSMTKEERKQVLVEIHGSNLETQSGDFQIKIKKLAKKLIAEGCLRWVGPYRPDEQRTRLKEIDWVIVPSIWWENSPMVIQEAFTAGRPLIVSNIGGMAEKVQDGVDGLHFSARNPLELANKLKYAVSNKTLWNDLHQNIAPPLSYTECAEEHMAFFETR